MDMWARARIEGEERIEEFRKAEAEKFERKLINLAKAGKHQEVRKLVKEEIDFEETASKIKGLTRGTLAGLANPFLGLVVSAVDIFLDDSTDLDEYIDDFYKRNNIEPPK